MTSDKEDMADGAETARLSVENIPLRKSQRRHKQRPAAAPTARMPLDLQDTRSYSFACFPLERILLIFGMLAGPGVTAVVLLRMSSALDGSSQSIFDVLSAGSPLLRLAAVGMLVLGVVCVVYGALYIQYRANSHLHLDATGLRFERKRFLPFGWLARAESLRWEDIQYAGFESGRWLLSKRPYIVIRWAKGRLRLIVSDAWNEADGKRPSGPKAPEGGWENSPLVDVLEMGWQWGMQRRAHSVAGGEGGKKAESEEED